MIASPIGSTKWLWNLIATQRNYLMGGCKNGGADLPGKID